MMIDWSAGFFTGGTGWYPPAY